MEQGANPVWERWDSFTRENGFDGATGKNNAAMNSFSHYAFGAVMEWAVRTLAGIDAIEPGYGRIRIRLAIPSAGSNPDGEPIDWVEAEYESVRGLIRSQWRRSGQTVKMQVTVPPNTTAEVSVPSDDAAGVLVDSQSLDEAIEGVRIINQGKRHSVGSHMASPHDGPAAACGDAPCRSGSCSPAAAGAGSSQKCDGV